MSANRARRRARQAAIEAIKADGNRLPAAQKAGGVTFSPEQAVALARASQVSTVANPLPQALLDAIPFGPGQPLRISPINAPRTDSGRPEPRQYEYPQSWNLPGFSDRLVPWAVLRSAADQIPLIRQCIEIRKNEVATLKWDIRISKDAIQQEMQRSGGSRQDVHTEMMKRLAPDIQRVKAFWEEPDKRNGHDFAAWANKFLEEHFVLDAVAIYPRLTRGGDPYSLEILDGSTIKPLLDEYGHRPLPPQPAYQQVLQGFPRGEFVADAVEDVGPDGEPQTTIPGAYPSDRLFYLVHNTRTTSPYGYSAVEQALIDGDLWLRRHGWIKAEYTDGVMPSGWLEAGPGQADWTPDQLTIYGDALNEYLAGDTKARQRFRILPYGMKPSDQTQAPERYKPDFDMFLLKLVARHLDTTIAELGFTEQGGLGSTGWHEGQADVQERAGTGPTIRRIESWCTRIGRRFLQSPPELEFAIVGDDEDEDATENKTWVEKTQAGGATLNEWRDEQGLPRYEFDEANKPFLVGAGGPIFLEGAIAKQEAQQAAADALTTARAAGALPVPPGEAGAAPGPGAGSQADGGQAKAPDDTATKADEIRGYRRWRRRNSDRARPFEFAHHTLADLAELGIDPAVDPVTIKADQPDLVKAGGTPKAPAPTPGPATWPGWEVDLALAQLYAETLSQGLTGVVPDGFVDSFIAAVEAGTARSAILDWIERHGPAADVVDTVRSALADLYTEGYLVGDRSAVSVLTGAPIDWADWSAGRPGAARKLISADGRQVGLQDLLDQAEVGIKSISANRLDELAGVLADGLDANQSPDEIARAVDGLFGDRQWAEMVTHTELSRAQTAASLDRYDEAGVGSTEWATAPDERVCEICKGNKDAGPVKLGERYPSGEYAPPGHPWCRCVILPTIDSDLFKVDYLVNLDIPEWVWAWDSSLHPRGPDGRFLPTMSGMRRLKDRHQRAKAAGRDLTKLNEEIGRRLQHWQGKATPVERPKPKAPEKPKVKAPFVDGTASPADLQALRIKTEGLDQERVAALADDMRRNGWQGLPLQLEETPRSTILGDGHHRLAAAQLAGLEAVPTRTFANTPEGRSAANRAMAETERVKELDAKTPEPPKPKAKAKDLLKQAGEQVMTGSLGQENPAEKEFMDLVRGSMEMTDPDSGLHVKVEQGSISGSGKAHVEFQIYNRDGVRQGSATRSWKTDQHGNLVVKHEWLKLRKGVQGSGFAAKWNAHNEAFYREHGVDRIELEANLDVGGYAWAKQGYNWSGPSAMQTIKEFIDERIESSDKESKALERALDPARYLEVRADLGIPPPLNPEDRAALDALRKRMTLAQFDAGTAPTPLAVAMAGYRQGQNQTDENGRESWAGKWIMLGATWDGVKKL